MNQRPIGVFDSGLGGLTAVRQLRRLMPSENIIYFGDTARVPYGNRGRETLLKYARQDLRFLSGFDLKAVVIACGTVSANCLEDLQAESSLPVIGVVDPACRRGVNAPLPQGAQVLLRHRLDDPVPGAAAALLHQGDFQRLASLFLGEDVSGQVWEIDISRY